MSKIQYFKRGGYPFESSFGIVANLSLMYSLPIKEVYNLITKRKIHKLQSLNIYTDWFSSGLPFCKFHDKECHFPSIFKCSDVNKVAIQKYCHECSLYGYHSVFFCLPQVKVCALHGCKLRNICEGCLFRLLDAPVSINPCSICGFFLPHPCEQVSFRLSPEININLFKSGSFQRKWFAGVVTKAKRGYSLFKEIDRVPDYFESPILGEFVTRLGFRPYYSNEIGRSPTSSVRTVRWIASEVLYTDLQWLGACQRLASLHFPRHTSCLICCEPYLKYWGGCDDRIETCVLGISYFLVRLRLSILSFRQGACSNVEDLGFNYIRALESSFGGFRFLSTNLVRLYFMKLIFNLNL